MTQQYQHVASEALQLAPPISVASHPSLSQYQVILRNFNILTWASYEHSISYVCK